MNHPEAGPPKRRSVAIVLPAWLPVPAVHGGAIESTIELLIEENEKKGSLDIVLFSPFDAEARALAERYEHCRVVWFRRTRAQRCVDLFIRVLRKVLRRRMDLTDGLFLRRAIRSIDADKVIVHGGSLRLLALARVVPREKLVFYIHANLFKFESPLHLDVGRAAGTYVTVSEFVKGKLVKFASVDPASVITIKNPIDWERFERVAGAPRPRKLVEKLGVEEEEAVILYVGRLVEGKGIRELLTAVAALPEHRRFKLLVVGTFGTEFGRRDDRNPFRTELLKLAETLGPKVSLIGFVPNRELPDFYALADVVLMPSVGDEAAGKVAMEGMAASLPVITSNSGGICEYVADGCGIVVKLGEGFVDELRDAIDFLLGNRDERMRMGAVGYEAARAFAPKRYHEDYCRLVSRNEDVVKG
jgi:spore coat protein SA